MSRKDGAIPHEARQRLYSDFPEELKQRVLSLDSVYERAMQ